MHCPLCIKRRWHLIRPVTPAQRENQSADDFHMKRIRRYYRWHRYNCDHIDKWQKLHDDGSLDSDRKLLIDMSAAKVKTKQQPTSTSANGAADGVNHGHGAHPSQSHGGEAAEYYNPDASRLETERASKTTRSLGGAHTAREGQRELAPSVSSSRPAPTRQNSNRSVQPDNAAASSTSKPDSRAPSSVRSSSTSSDVASKPKSSVVKSALESGLAELSKVASSAVSNSLVSGVADTDLSASKHSTAPTSASDGSQHDPSVTQSKSKAAQQLADQAKSEMSRAASKAPSSSRATLSQRVGEKLESMLPSSKAVATKVASSVIENSSKRSDAAAG